MTTAVETLQIDRLDNIESHVAMPTLYGKKSNGGIKQWTVGYIVYDDGTAIMRRCHGTVGKKIVVTDKKCTPKFVGKANERNAAEQARFEMNAAHQKQLNVGMQLTIEAAKSNRVILPMLAQSYKRGEGRYPAYAQPKLNGVRCLSHQQNAMVDLITRKNKRYNEALGHLIKHLLSWGGSDGEWIGDGEVYKHGWSLQKISGAARAYKPGISDQLQYWVYDIADEAIDFEERWAAIEKLFLGGDEFAGGFLVKVPTVLVKSEKQFQRFHDELVELGFEGAILRQPKGMYRLGLVRSADLEKYKDFIDHEFEIIGGRPAEGTQEGCVIFRVRGEAKDKDDKLTGKVVEFDVVPKGDLELRRQWMKDIDKLIGKDLTVRYFELSDDGVPQGNPVGDPMGECIRDYE